MSNEFLKFHAQKRMFLYHNFAAALSLRPTQSEETHREGNVFLVSSRYVFAVPGE